MKTAAVVAAILATARDAFAAYPAALEGAGLLGFVFLAFGALIVVTQLLPALTLLGAMVAGLFPAEPAAGTDDAREGVVEAR